MIDASSGVFISAADLPCAECGSAPRLRYPSGPCARCADCQRKYQSDRRQHYREEARKRERATVRAEESASVSVSVLSPAQASAPSPSHAPASASRASDQDTVYGVLADMLLLVDRVRNTLTNRAGALRVALDIDGARVHMGVERLPETESERHE